MQETVYKTKTPEEPESEFYEIAVLSRPGNGFEFIEKHGWWDDSAKQIIHEVITISPEEGLTIEDAERMFIAQRESRARCGFIHSFSREREGQGKDVYQLISL
jgi:hypothetical protein